MYMNTLELNHSAVYPKQQSKRSGIRVHCQHRRRLSKQAKEKGRVRMLKRSEMEMKNMKIYMENQIIIQENENLRKKLLLLHQENIALLSQLQKK